MGCSGGQPGARGENVLIVEGREIPLKGKCVLTLEPGSIVSVRTPGGGGYGEPKERAKQLIEQDRLTGKMSRL
jgi:N-methylhydantoinase B